jgi:hypothetical protein
VASVQGDVTALLSEDSDIAYWHLAANPEAPGGVNDIQVEIVSAVTTDTKVEISYYERFMNGS